MVIDVRVTFGDGGRPKILLAKKNEAKIVVFDVLSYTGTCNTGPTNAVKHLVQLCATMQADFMARL